MHWQWPVGAVLAFLLALATTPAGVSGAVLLLPVQLSVLRVASPSVTPTNLLFNVAATPGGLLRFWREHRLGGPLTGVLVVGTLPGVIAGAILRVEVFSGQRSFTIIAALVLLPIGLWLLLGAQNLARPRPVPTRRHRVETWLLAVVVGIVGGLYGVGGGSILAPILIALGYTVFEVAPATLAATFLTSVVGVVTYQVLQVVHGGTIARSGSSAPSSVQAGPRAATVAPACSAGSPSATSGAFSGRSPAWSRLATSRRQSAVHRLRARPHRTPVPSEPARRRDAGWRPFLYEVCWRKRDGLIPVPINLKSA